MILLVLTKRRTELWTLDRRETLLKFGSSLDLELDLGIPGISLNLAEMAS